MKDVTLGLHKDQWHDTGAAVVARAEDGSRIIAHVNQERLDRRKNSRGFPHEATVACFRELGLNGPEVADLVVMDYVMTSADWRRDFRRHHCRTDVFLDDISRSRIKMVSHHLCHAAASFFTSKFQEAAVLVVDGRGSLIGDGERFESQSLWIGSESNLELVEVSDKPGIGALYGAITERLGFSFLQAGKTMGLAPFGADKPGPIAHLSGHFDGIHVDYGHLCDFDNNLMSGAQSGTLNTSEWQRLAFDVQQECEKAMVHLAAYARKKTGLGKLCVGGGVGLNGLANAKIRSSGLFDDLFINPACSDSGVSLGAALWGYHSLLGIPRQYEDVTPYTGPSYSDTHIRGLLSSLPYRLVEPGLEEVIRLLEANRVIALFEGRSEMGPRALGNRSILMHPGPTRNRDYLNKVVKRREPFRPFAPCIPLNRAREFFELDCESPYMLLVVPVRPEWRSRLAAVTHVDGSARVQTVTPEANPVLYQILTLFGEQTGVPVLLNTSFNLKDQPLVETPEDALTCFANSDLDGLLVNDVLITK